jgi:hypothetical protein
MDVPERGPRSKLKTEVCVQANAEFLATVVAKFRKITSRPTKIGLQKKARRLRVTLVEELCRSIRTVGHVNRWRSDHDSSSCRKSFEAGSTSEASAS